MNIFVPPPPPSFPRTRESRLSTSDPAKQPELSHARRKTPRRLHHRQQTQRHHLPRRNLRALEPHLHPQIKIPPRLQFKIRYHPPRLVRTPPNHGNRHPPRTRESRLSASDVSFRFFYCHHLLFAPLEVQSYFLCFHVSGCVLLSYACGKAAYSKFQIVSKAALHLSKTLSDFRL